MRPRRCAKRRARRAQEWLAIAGLATAGTAGLLATRFPYGTETGASPARLPGSEHAEERLSEVAPAALRSSVTVAVPERSEPRNVNQVEVYGADGRLLKRVTVARDPVVERGDDRIVDPMAPSLADSLATWKGPSTANPERRRAIRDLARSSSGTVIEALDQPVFAAAQAPDLNGPVDGPDSLNEAKDSVESLYEKFQEIEDTISKKNFVHVLSSRAAESELTDFLLKTIEDSSTTIRHVTVLELNRLTELELALAERRVDWSRMIPALEQRAQSDPARRVRQSAQALLQTRELGPDGSVGVP